MSQSIQISPGHSLGSSIQVHHIIHQQARLVDIVHAFFFQEFNDLRQWGGVSIPGKGNVQISFGGKMLIFLIVYYMPGMELSLVCF
jgi:hypothetical protein